MVEQDWGRIVNVTTKLDTMNRPHTSPYGGSQAALEMATEVWARVEGTGLTVNIVNPGAGANTPGMAEEMRAMGRAPHLVAPDEMVPPLFYLAAREARHRQRLALRRQLVGFVVAALEAARRAGFELTG
jgi:3-oxoacyl-[acyl-carrier protein] reductase